MAFTLKSSFHATSSQPRLLIRNLNGPKSRSFISASLHSPSLHRSTSINDSNLTHRYTSILLSSPRNFNFTVRASTAAENTPQPSSSASSSNRQLIVVTSAITILVAVVDRVLYKLALVPMKPYPFFLAQLTTFG